MKIEHSEHWKRKKIYRKDITDDAIMYAVSNSNALRDKHGENTLNAICRVPPSGRILKVVYRKISENKVRIVTAFWLD